METKGASPFPLSRFKSTDIGHEEITMSFAASASAVEPRSFSLGPVKVEIVDYTAVSGDTSGTVTASKLSRVDAAIVCGGVALTAAPTISGLTVTLAFADPAANRAGSIILFGR